MCVFTYIATFGKICTALGAHNPRNAVENFSHKITRHVALASLKSVLFQASKVLERLKQSWLATILES